MGRTPDEAFFVDISNTTMTSADINDGKLVCMVGVAPIKPSEFYFIRIIQQTQTVVTKGTALREVQRLQKPKALRNVPLHSNDNMEKNVGDNG